MKKLIFAFLLCCLPLDAATIYRAKLVFSGIPANNDTVTYNGETLTWKTMVTSSSDQIEIGASATISAGNLYAHLAQYPIDDMDVTYDGSLTVNEVGTLDTVITASISGSYGTMSVVTTSLTQRALILPLLGQPAGTRGDLANDLVAAFDQASAQFAANSWVFTNFMNLSLSQTISGDKNFTGTGNIYNGGSATNMTVARLKVPRFTEFAGLQLSSNTVAAPTYTIVGASSDGQPEIRVLNADGTLASGPTSPDGSASILTRGTADARYVRDGISHTVSAAWGFTGTINPTLIDGTLYSATITNIAGLHTLANFFTDSVITGVTTLSNSAPYLQWYETDQATDEHIFRITAEAGELQFASVDDSNGELSIFTLTRDGEFVLIGQGEVRGGLNITTEPLTVEDDIYTDGPIVIGDSTSPTVPSGLVGLYVLTSGGISSDPTTGAALYDNSGWRYRTSTTSEGSGIEARLHNRTDETIGAGTDYSLTTSTAAVDLGTTDPRISLPTAGTYRVEADIALLSGGTANDEYRFKLRDETNAADLVSDIVVSSLGATERQSLTISGKITVTATANVALWGHNATAARGTVESARTRIRYIRLY